MALLDALFSPVAYLGQNAGLLGRIPEWMATAGPSQGFPGSPQLPAASVPAGPAPVPAPAPAPAEQPSGGLGGLLGGLFGGGSPTPASAGPGVGDRLSAGFQGFVNSGSPMQAIGNLIGGLTTGQRSDPMGMLLQQRQATFGALTQAGVPAGVAMAAALNPTILQTIAPQLYQKPQLVSGGTDPLTGVISHQLYNPNTQTLTPLAATGAPGTAAPMPGAPSSTAGSMQQIADAVRSDATGQEFLNQLPKAFALQVQQIAEGRAPYPSGFMLKTPYGQMLTQALAKYEPGLTAQDYSTRMATAKAFDVGTEAKSLRSVNQAILHAQTLNDLIDKLGNSQYLPGITNTITQGVRGQYDPNFQNNLSQFRNTVNALASEMTKAFRGNSGAIQDVEHWRQTMSETASPAALKGGIQAAMKLLGGAIESLGSQYNKGMRSNKDPLELVDPKNRAVYDELLSGTAPTNEAGAPAAAPTIAEGATATNPQTGQKIVFKNGQWVPVQ